MEPDVYFLRHPQFPNPKSSYLKLLLLLKTLIVHKGILVYVIFGSAPFPALEISIYEDFANNFQAPKKLLKNSI